MARAVFLDRDGVINRAYVRDGKPYPPDTVAEFELLPGVKEAIAKLKAAGFLIVVVTNQPDVGAGRQKREIVDTFHAHIRHELAIDSIKVCYHVDQDNCGCRKPKPGMLLEAAREHDISLGESCLVGDRWRDIAAGQSVGCQAYFIDYGYAEKRPENPYIPVESLLQAATHILKDRFTENNSR
jgi:D-glycero-D-manno-heptose 1,7-bisphosphate phosphatase